MKIGVRVHDFGKSDAITLAKQAKEVGFDGSYTISGNPYFRRIKGIHSWLEY